MTPDLPKGYCAGTVFSEEDPTGPRMTIPTRTERTRAQFSLVSSALEVTISSARRYCSGTLSVVDDAAGAEPGVTPSTP